MNTYEIEQFLLSQGLNGGYESKISDGHLTDGQYKFPIYHAKYTRPIMSVFEYTQAIHILANDINARDNLDKYIGDFEVKNFINPSFLAFYLIENGKWDAIVTRNGNEKITFSTLKKDPRWRDYILELIERKNKSMDDEFKEIYDLMKN